MQLDLVDRRNYIGRGDDPLEVLHREVGHTDGKHALAGPAIS
jgi:hypothetical protein